MVSSGFDAHCSDPLTSLGLSSGDFAALTRRTLGLRARQPCVMFLVGGMT